MDILDGVIFDTVMKVGYSLLCYKLLLLKVAKHLMDLVGAIINLFLYTENLLSPYY